MTFNPRRLADGRVCCSAEYALCDECKAHHAATFRTSLRTNAASESFAPPDPYATAIEALRASDAKAAAERNHTPVPRPATMPLDANGIPDAYAAGLAAMKENTR